MKSSGVLFIQCRKEKCNGTAEWNDGIERYVCGCCHGKFEVGKGFDPPKMEEKLEGNFNSVRNLRKGQSIFIKEDVSEFGTYNWKDE